MFADTDLAFRIDSAEARLTKDAVYAVQTDGTADAAFIREIGGGIAAFVRPGSPMNKIIGAGIREPISEDSLNEVELLYRAQNEPVRFELSTLAQVEVGRRLTERGYRLMGFENVLGCDLRAKAFHKPEITQIDKVESAQQLAEWKEIVVSGACCPDETGVVADVFTLETIRRAIEDSASVSGYDRYLALVDSMNAGGASMRLDGDIVFLTGATTIPDYRRRGVQTALLAQRLFDACNQAAELAVITTSGGTRSQANSMRYGFELLYSRAILVLE